MKKLTALLISILICIGMAGCNTSTETNDTVDQIEVSNSIKPIELIPDLEEYFPDAQVDILVSNEDVVLSHVKNLDPNLIKTYRNACKEAGFSDIQYQNGDKIYRAYNEENTYSLSLSYLSSEILHITCKVIDSEVEE